MPKVRALRDCYVDRLRREGDVFEYSGPKNPNLEPVKNAPVKTEEEPEPQK